MGEGRGHDHDRRNALLIQAGFLLVFDFTLFFLHRSIDRSVLDRMTVTPDGLGLSF